MKWEEQVAEKWLRGLAQDPVMFEPDGNIPPDFSLGEAIGVEVRRLNENYFSGSEPKGLEEVAIPLFQALESTLRKFDVSRPATGYWVFAEFQRPVQPAREIMDVVRSKLCQFLQAPRLGACEVTITEDLSLHLYPAAHPTTKIFRMGGGSDEDSGGKTTELCAVNANHCLADKIKKVSKVQSAYATWWLVLVDTIGWLLDSDEERKVQELLSGLGLFERLVILDPSTSQSVFEINS